MATRRITDTSRIPYDSSGIYFKETDLTVVTRATGNFSAASICLAEKGPMFEISSSSTYEDRAFRLGELNPDYPGSYYAKQYLEQATNFKEIRLGGLEGYTDSKGYAIVLDISGSAARVAGTSSLKIGAGGLMAVLKERPRDLTGRLAITKVEVDEATYVDADSGVTVSTATDYLFDLVITYSDSTVERMTTSLRPESKEYIVKKLWNKPHITGSKGEKTFPMIKNKINPLWVDFIIPSVKTRPAISDSTQLGYYTPNSSVRLNALSLLTGDMTFGTNFTYQSGAITAVAALTSGSTVIGTRVTVTGDIRGWFAGSGYVSAVAPTGTVTITAIGADDDGIIVQLPAAISGNPYSEAAAFKTSAETTTTALATKLKNAINDGTSVTGYTATSSGAVVTIIAPIAIGDTLNGDAITVTATGGATATNTAFTGGVTGVTGTAVRAVTIKGVAGTGNITVVNGTWAISNLVFSGGVSTFELNDLSAATASTPTTVPLATLTTTSSLSGGTPTANKYEVPTWESQVLDFANVPYQTPQTPWFVSDGDANGDFKRLFKFHAISDGKSGNTECKIEVKNINPAGNNGKGTFDILIRKWTDREDLEAVRLEAYNNLTMDKTNDNYIERRIGNGDDFILRSKFVFIEMNKEEEIEDDTLPYGITGYPNVSGGKFRDVQFTLAYDKKAPLQKQVLGLSNNKINTFGEVAPDMLAYKSGTLTDGKGFHLNPKNNTTFATDQANAFQFASQSIYTDLLGVTVAAPEKVRRSHYVVDFYGGFDGWNVYTDRKWDDPTSKDYESLQIAVNQLKDKENIDADFTILVTPDFQLDNAAAACDLVHEMVRERGDCFYIPDFGYDELADTVAAVDLLRASNLRSSSTAVYFPWLQIADPINKKNKWLPPSLLALGTITYTAMNENVWQPPGGAIRTVTNNLVRSRRRLKIEDREILKSANINPITLFPGSGYEITEVRTTQEYFSALSFIHNRLLLCYAKKVLNQVLRPLLFHMNGEITKDAFLSTVRPIFDRIKKLNGVEEYSVNIKERPELNDRTTIYGEIEIVPLYAVERIVIDFNLRDSLLTFNDLPQ